MVGWWTGFPFWQSFLICVFGGILGVTFSIAGEAAVGRTLATYSLDFGDGADSGPLAGPIVGKFTDPAGQSFDVRELVVKHTYAATMYQG